MKANKATILQVALIINAFLLVATYAAAQDSVSASGLEASPYQPADTVTIMSIEYGPWSSWITIAEYCTSSGLGFVCLCTTLPGEVDYVDQYRERTAINTSSGQEWIDYQYRTAAAGCCGFEIIDCIPPFG